jgi:hypothetical protein
MHSSPFERDTFYTGAKAERFTTGQPVTLPSRSNCSYTFLTAIGGLEV